MHSCSVTNIEITLTNLLEFTHSSEQCFFQKVILRSYTYSKLGSSCLVGVCVRQRQRDRELQETANLLMLWFLPLISTPGHVGNYYGFSWGMHNKFSNTPPHPQPLFTLNSGSNYFRDTNMLLRPPVIMLLRS